MTPLHLELNSLKWSVEKLDAFERLLESHISHTRHLSFSGPLNTAPQRLVSSPPALEFLSLSHGPNLLFQPPKAVIPVNLFNYSAPSLTSLKLLNCDISWKPPLFNGLRTLEMHMPSTNARPDLEDWLNALNEMPQLETLHLQSASPLASQATPLISAVTLPSLIGFRITASAKDCAIALAHLSLPALTWLHVEAESLEWEGEDVRLVIPHVARNVYGLLGTESIRSILINGGRKRAEVAAWTMPDADDVHDLRTLFTASVTARLKFGATGDWDDEVDTAIFDSLLALLPVDSVSTLTVQRTQLNKEFWLSHAPRWPLLERARLVPTAVKAFRDILAEDAPPDGPRLPSLTKLILVNVRLTGVRAYHLGDMLIKRVKQGVLLEVLDLRLCLAADSSIQWFEEIVVDVQVPLEKEPGLDNYGGIGYCNDVEYDDGDYDEDQSESRSEYNGDYEYDDYMRWASRRVHCFLPRAPMQLDRSQPSNFISSFPFPSSFSRTFSGL
jgi:hypothetical protein